jgi:cytochrome bd ubiquinol oxidase subunit II
MPAPDLLLAGAMVGALVLYFLFGGADFGGGVWDLLASGPRKAVQRDTIEHAIGPIWEANHVWLILVVVIVFGAFPPAFAALSIALHVPLTLFLLGVVFRGSSFAFRSFDKGPGQRRYGRAFSIASVVSPVLLGMVVGAAASGRIEVSGRDVHSGAATWLAPFPVVTGLLALALCAFLAATYLTLEAPTPELADDFRRRALTAAAVVAVFAMLALLLAFEGAPHVARRLTGRPWAWVIEALATAAAVGAALALLRRNFRVARALAASQVALIVLGWAAAQFPYLLVDDLTITGAAADPRTLRVLVYALLAGLPVLLPSLYLLFRIFKTQDPQRVPNPPR